MSHHPSASRLTEYSAGGMAYGPALCISIHLERCHECSRLVDNLNLLGAAILDQVEPADCSDKLFNRVLSSLGRPEQGSETPAAAAANEVLAMRSALDALLPEGINSVRWKRHTKGISSFELPAVNDEAFTVKLLNVAKGASVYQHTHTGSEFTVLLQGGYSDELGSYAAGDFVECNSRHVHKPVAHRDQDCILLAAVEGDLRFTGTFSRLLNPVFKF